MSTIAENIANIRAQMADAAKKAGRDPSEILLCAATKMNDADRVKEAVFSIIQFEIEGRRVLDLFAGSGQLGIEALSRGAASATFVDMSKDSLSAVKYNLEHTKLGDNAKVVQTDALSFLKLTKDRFDIVFLDPPYASSLVVDSMKLLSDVVAAGGCAICETPVDSELPESFGELKFHRSYRYGKIKITVYRKEGEDE